MFSSTDSASKAVRRTRRGVTVTVGALAGTVLMSTAAFAHHPEISATTACEGVVTFTSTAWASNVPAQRTNADIRISYAVNGATTFVALPDKAEYAYNAANGYRFSDTFTVAVTPASTVRVKATAVGPWGSGAAAGDSRMTSVLTFPTCPPEVVPPVVVVPPAATPTVPIVPPVVVVTPATPTVPITTPPAGPATPTVPITTPPAGPATPTVPVVPVVTPPAATPTVPVSPVVPVVTPPAATPTVPVVTPPVEPDTDIVGTPVQQPVSAPSSSPTAAPVTTDRVVASPASAPSPASLPFTGAPTGLLLLIGLGLAVVGGVCTAAGRRIARA